MMYGPQQMDQAQKLRQIVQAVREQEELVQEGKPSRVIAVTSGKGGVGKTNLVVNLAVALAARRLKVVVFDADLGLANIDVMMGLIPKYTLAHVLDGEKAIEEIILQGPGGVAVLPGGMGLVKLADLPPEQMEILLSALRRVDRLYDLCLIDTGAGIGRQVLSFLRMAQEIIVVTTPEPTAVTDAYGLIKAVRQSNLQGSIGVVVNMAENSREAEDVFTRLQTVSQRFLGVGITYLGWVERDSSVSRAIREQVPFLLQYPHSRASRCLHEVVDNLLKESGGNKEPGGLWGFFRQALGNGLK